MSNNYADGAKDTISRITDHIEKRLVGIDAQTAEKIGLIGFARDLIDLLITMTDELKPCPSCLEAKCRCDELDAKRKYGREETWYGNDY